MVSPSCTRGNARNGLSNGNDAVPNCTGAPVTLASTYHLDRAATIVTVAVPLMPGPTAAVITTVPGARGWTVPSASPPARVRLDERHGALDKVTGRPAVSRPSASVRELGLA